MPYGYARGTSGPGKSCPLTLTGLLCRKPLLAGIIVVSHQFLLLGVHRNDRPPRRQGPLHLGVDMTELGIAVGMILAFLHLPIALQAVVLIAQKLRHFLIADWMLLPCQFGSQRPGAFADPPQGRFGIATRFRLQSDDPTRRVAWDRAPRCSSGPHPTGEYVPALRFPSAISRIPLAMAFRERPLARRILDTPPYPKARASLAAISRRLRSSRSSHTLENFRRRELSSFSIPK